MTNLNRRSFLKTVCAGACGSLIHNSVLGNGDMLAYAMPPSVQGAFGPNPIMVVLNLAGGADHTTMSTLYSNWWMDKNPNLAYTPQTSIPLNADQGLHPALTYLKTLWDENALAIVNMVGMGVNGVPMYTRAHDLDTDGKLSGYPGGSSAFGGWAPRLTAQMSSSLGGVTMSDQALITQGDVNPPRAINNLQNLGETAISNVGQDQSNWMRFTRDAMMINGDAPSSEKHKVVRDSILNVEAAAQTLSQYANATLPVQFPNSGLGNNFRDIARIVNANVGAQFFFCQIGGFDTHNGARAGVTNLLTTINAAIQALVDCAKAQGWWGRLMIMNISEFGRTTENGDFANAQMAGNDHGFANAMWVIGGNLHGGRIIAPPPALADLGGGTYIKNYHVDYRAIFKEAITAMGYNADAVFPQTIANSAYTPTGLF